MFTNAWMPLARPAMGWRLRSIVASLAGRTSPELPGARGGIGERYEMSADAKKKKKKTKTETNMFFFLLMLF